MLIYILINISSIFFNKTKKQCHLHSSLVVVSLVLVSPCRVITLDMSFFID